MSEYELMHTLGKASAMSTTGYAYALIHTSIMQRQILVHKRLTVGRTMRADARILPSQRLLSSSFLLHLEIYCSLDATEEPAFCMLLLPSL
jgi:hypothetical protein